MTESRVLIVFYDRPVVQWTLRPVLNTALTTATVIIIIVAYVVITKYFMGVAIAYLLILETLAPVADERITVFTGPVDEGSKTNGTRDWWRHWTRQRTDVNTANEVAIATMALELVVG
jgi:hypothetical protein